MLPFQSYHSPLFTHSPHLQTIHQITMTATPTWTECQPERQWSFQPGLICSTLWLQHREARDSELRAASPGSREGVNQYIYTGVNPDCGQSLLLHLNVILNLVWSNKRLTVVILLVVANVKRQHFFVEQEQVQEAELVSGRRKWNCGAFYKWWNCSNKSNLRITHQVKLLN